MTEQQAVPTPGPDWDPQDPAVQRDQTAAYDRMRRSCPVAHSETMNWSLFSHEDVLRALEDHETFSSRVSSHLSVPNGLDQPEHTPFREIVDRYYTPERMDEFRPVLERITRDLVASLAGDARAAGGHGGEAASSTADGGPTNRCTVDVEAVAELGRPFALRCQSAFMGWPEDLEPALQRWVRRNHEATASRDRTRTAEVALEFDGYIRDLLRERADVPADADNTARLLNETVDGRRLTEEEIVSIIRNWTVGELATIAAGVGVVTGFLARNPQVQAYLREHPEHLVPASDEMLRIEDPFVTNRRVTTRDVSVGDRTLPAGSKVTLMWSSANRDERVVGDPDEFRLDRDPAQNLVYGAGIHVCPGAPMARLELEVLMRELFERTAWIEPAGDPVPARHPAGAYESVTVRFVVAR